LTPRVLEIGCGDGMFTELAGVRVDHAIDREARAVDRAARRPVYAAVTRMDAHDLGPELGRFGTIFSNSVLEHIPDVERVLPRCLDVLAPGGRLVTTVPLRDMSDHLALGSERYARARQQQLLHRNLWTLEEWTAKLRAAGFAAVEAHPFLDAASCRRWDRLDAAGALGRGRYRVAPILHRFASIVLPTRVKARLKRGIAEAIVGWAARPADGPPCAALVIATAPE
jgi:SAM-dependent methyltransferase